jgi:hypothetical protein
MSPFYGPADWQSGLGGYRFGRPWYLFVAPIVTEYEAEGEHPRIPPSAAREPNRLRSSSPLRETQQVARRRPAPPREEK